MAREGIINTTQGSSRDFSLTENFFFSLLQMPHHTFSQTKKSIYYNRFINIVVCHCQMAKKAHFNTNIQYKTDVTKQYFRACIDCKIVPQVTTISLSIHPALFFQKDYCMNINKFDDYFWTTKPQLCTPTQPKAHRLQMDAGCWQTELSLQKGRIPANTILTKCLFVCFIYVCQIEVYS